MAFITIVPAAPLRATASHRAEMVSQLLFGELCTILETEGDFFKVKVHFDGYEGWCQASQLAEFGKEDYDELPFYASGYYHEVLINGDSTMVPFASVLPFKASHPVLELKGYQILNLSQLTESGQESADRLRQLQEFAFRYLGVGYLWGGKSVFGTDCSGFVQQVYKMMGITLPRDAWQQANEGEMIDFVQEARLGDLAFFDNAEGRIIHVGLMLNNQQIIHASGNVHIDQIDHAGIINHISGKRTHQLRTIRRLIGG